MIILLTKLPGMALNMWPGTAKNMQQLMFVRSYSNAGQYYDNNSCRDASKQQTIDLFWKNFIKELESLPRNQSQSNVNKYHNKVFELLITSKEKLSGQSPDMEFLQQNIENWTMKFDENNVFTSLQSSVKLIIDKDLITAKDYLKQKKYYLSEKELSYINVFGQYTLEAIIFYVLGSLFTCVEEFPFIRASTLIDQLDSNVRVQAINLGMNNKASIKQEKRRLYYIGVGLLEFLIERDFIRLKTESSYNPKVFSNKVYKQRNCYVMCNFDLSLLPIKLNLPMLVKPLDWKSKIDVPSTLADIEGGYLSELTGEMHNRFRLLTSRNYSHFYIKLKNSDSLCNVLNKLQSQVFEVNTKLLTFIENNMDTLEEEGIIENRILGNVGNLQKASDLLRLCYLKDEDGVKNVCSCHFLLKEFFTRVQRARYEAFILQLAKAYSGYQFYLPAFMDFRGRIYRTGVLHFHERDLSKSLLIFSSDGKAPELSKSEEIALRKQLACAASFKYKKFSNLSDSHEWYVGENLHKIRLDKSLIDLVKDASDPFQFLSKVLSLDRVDDSERIQGLHKVPVTQDASASAYQIMSYLLLNAEMGRLTNLLPSPDNQIQDLYQSLKNELKEFLKSRLDTNKYTIIDFMLTRKLVKTLFMPLIYGKTVIAMAHDISLVYGSLLSVKDNYHIAQLCQEFWRKKYPDIVNLMKLINLIGWFCSFLDKPVLYSIPYFTTIQDYMRSKKADIWIYDKVCKKRRRITLRVPAFDRDKRKTQVSTCVNFIHQKDAFIAMKVVEQFTLKKAPVYTVHDNFITTSVYAKEVPAYYIKVFMGMGPPLHIINEFLIENLNLSGEFSSLLSFNSVNDELLSSESLRTLLISLVPKDLSSKEKNKWDNKVSDTVTCYEEYVNTVCGGMCHAEKWNEYHSLLKSWESLEFNYSVHY